MQGSQIGLLQRLRNRYSFRGVDDEHFPKKGQGLGAGIRVFGFQVGGQRGLRLLREVEHEAAGLVIGHENELLWTKGVQIKRPVHRKGGRCNGMTATGPDHEARGMVEQTERDKDIEKFCVFVGAYLRGRCAHQLGNELQLVDVVIAREEGLATQHLSEDAAGGPYVCGIQGGRMGGKEGGREGNGGREGQL